jgi:hypothetical protein
MLRQSLVVGCMAFVLATAAPFGAPCALLAQSQETSLNAVKSGVLAATGYDGGAVELTATKAQFVVTIVNSKLIGSPAAERENEATRIASTIASIIADKPEFKGIQGIHVDYVKREADGSHTQRIDGIDFRKDPQGNFQHHIT